jgi:hypothetical protein
MGGVENIIDTCDTLIVEYDLKQNENDNSEEYHFVCFDNLDPGHDTSISAIHNNPKAQLVFQKWGIFEKGQFKFYFEMNKDYFLDLNGTKRIYQINFDTLRLFGYYDWPCEIDGYIFEYLSSDSLVLRDYTNENQIYVTDAL